MRLRLPALLCVLAAAMIGPSVASAATVAQNLTRVGVPAADRAADLAVAARAAAVAQRLGGERGQAINAVLASAVRVARRRDLTPALARVVFLELDANATYLAAHALPPAGTRIRIDDIVYESYSGQGLRVQPLGTYFAILEPGQGIAAEGGVAAALTRAQQLVVPVGNRYTLPYLLPYAGTDPPWYSAMAESVAASASVSVWNRTGDDRYLDWAIRFGNAALARAIPTGGSGLWFPLYAARPDYRVLNGTLQAVLAMNDLADATGDSTFADAASQGAAAVRAVLPRYTTGGWGRYAIGEDAPVKYMTLMSAQLQHLGAITGDQAFTAMGQAFASYLRTPPVVSGPQQPLKPLRLQRIQGRPYVRLRVRRDKPIRLTIRVTRQAGGAAGVGPFSIDVASGTSAIKVVLPHTSGRYVIRATARDWAGNRVAHVVLARVRVQR